MNPLLLKALKKKSYSIRRAYVDSFLIDQSEKLDANALTLDLGGLKNDKRGYYSSVNYFKNIFHLNIAIDRYPDLCGDITSLPIRSNSFQQVICAEVLEHIFEVERAIQEIERILMPGGLVLITVPFLYRVHGDPSDYGRYTEHFWEKILNHNGFEICTIEKQGGFFPTVVDFAKQYLNYKCHGKKLFLVDEILFQIQRWAVRSSSSKDKDFLSNFVGGYGIVAIKK